MFDYDGTLTDRGVFQVENDLAERIGELLNAGFPLAVCTGRQLSSFAKRFGPVIEQILGRFGEEAMRNLYLLAENGAVGYEFVGGGAPCGAGADDETGDGTGAEPCDEEANWKTFYIAKWPNEVPKDAFENRLHKLLDGKVEILTHLVPIVLAPIGRVGMHIDEVNRLSAEIFNITYKFMSEYDAGGKTALDYLHIGDSGLGCLICPADGDKDNAVKVFHEFLKDSRGMEFEEDAKCREIMVIGDNPQTGGNDHYFLNGRYGTSFTVGEDPDDGADLPHVVLDDGGRKILHDRGTLFLLNRLQNT